MHFRISDTFTASLTRLPNEQQKAAKTTVFDLQTNSALPSLNLHRLHGTQDRNFWSARVSRDLRIILHRTEENTVVCYAGHHDDAYRWAERRKLETHPTTGAAQLVTLREVVQEIAVPVYRETKVQVPKKALLFAHLSDDQLLRYGVPMEWLEEVRGANEDTVLDIADHLPEEAADAVLELAVGKTPRPSLSVSLEVDPFDHPDALRRFHTTRDEVELDESLDQPWEKWTIPFDSIGELVENVKKIRSGSHQSWSNLHKAVRALQGIEHEPFGTPNVANSSKSCVRKILRETGLTTAKLETLLGEIKKPSQSLRLRLSVPAKLDDKPLDRVKEIRTASRQSWSNICKAVKALQDKEHEPFGTRNVESSSKSCVRRILRETGLTAAQFETLLDQNGFCQSR